MSKNLGSDTLEAPALTAQTDDARALTLAGLAKIFARVLRRPHVGEDDDFFDLGGDSILAMRLMVEIKRLTGQDLPITSIYEAPTIRTIALLLADGAQRRDSCLVLLKPGAQDAPLFIVHVSAELRELARRTDTDQAIWGLNGDAAPFDRIEDTARFYLDEVKRMQPNGPYFLAGYCFGGLVALEMARILSKAGQNIALVAMLDSYFHAKYWPLRCQIFAFKRKARLYAAEVLRTKLSREAVLSILRCLGRTATDFFPRLSAGIPVPAAVKEVQRARKLAFASYRPRFYDAEITLIKAELSSSDAQMLWSPYARKVTVYMVPGDHVDLLKERLGSAASCFSSALREAIARQPGAEAAR